MCPLEALGSAWTFLDLTPFGPYRWWRRHDEYNDGASHRRRVKETAR